MHDEASYLALLHVVETDHADKAVRVLQTGKPELRSALPGAGGVKQGELPHGPVVGFGVRSLVKFNGREVAHL